MSAFPLRDHTSLQTTGTERGKGQSGSGLVLLVVLCWVMVEDWNSLRYWSSDKVDQISMNKG